MSMPRGPVIRWIAAVLIIAGSALAATFARVTSHVPQGAGTEIAPPGVPVAGYGHAPPGSLPGYDPTVGACTGPRQAQAVLYGVGPVCAPWDSIPAIDHPRFIHASEVRFVHPDEPVIALDWRGFHRAYPIQILSYHEIVNDEVGGSPIAVTFCPLCNSAVAFSRVVDGRTLTFAVTGQLNFANLVMFDRQTVSEWRQLEGVAISGPFKGRRLKLVPVQMVSFGEWRAAHPEGLVMRRPPASPFHYGVDPYATYDADPTQPSILLRGEPVDPRLLPKRPVVGVATGRGSVAFAAPMRGSGSVVETARVGSLQMVAFFRYGVAQPEMSYELSSSPRGWSGSVWIARLGSRDLRFVVRGGKFVETTTGSGFDFFGRGITGPLAGKQLLAPPQATAFWFAWSAFHPHTELAKAP